MAPRVASDGGRVSWISLDSYRPPQAGQTPATKLLSRHGLPSSLGAWGLGYTDKHTTTPAPGKKTRICNKKSPVLKRGCWNVRTMTTGLEDPQNISDARKTAVINDELMRLRVDIVALQETRLADSGSLKERDYTFFWQASQRLWRTWCWICS